MRSLDPLDPDYPRAYDYGPYPYGPPPECAFCGDELPDGDPDTRICLPCLEDDPFPEVRPA